MNNIIFYKSSANCQRCKILQITYNKDIICMICNNVEKNIANYLIHKSKLKKIKSCSNLDVINLN